MLRNLIFWMMIIFLGLSIGNTDLLPLTAPLLLFSVSLWVAIQLADVDITFGDVDLNTVDFKYTYAYSHYNKLIHSNNKVVLYHNYLCNFLLCIIRLKCIMHFKHIECAYVGFLPSFSGSRFKYMKIYHLDKIYGTMEELTKIKLSSPELFDHIEKR